MPKDYRRIRTISRSQCAAEVAVGTKWSNGLRCLCKGRSIRSGYLVCGTHLNANKFKPHVTAVRPLVKKKKGKLRYNWMKDYMVCWTEDNGTRHWQKCEAEDSQLAAERAYTAWKEEHETTHGLPLRPLEVSVYLFQAEYKVEQVTVVKAKKQARKVEKSGRKPSAIAG